MVAVVRHSVSEMRYPEGACNKAKHNDECNLVKWWRTGNVLALDAYLSNTQIKGAAEKKIGILFSPLSYET